MQRYGADLGQVESGLATSGHVGQPVAQAVKEILGATVLIAMRSELHLFAVIPSAGW